jgi:pfkB family carbohydrate kinase
MDIGAPPRLFTVGSIVADIRLEVPHLPVRGGDVLASAGHISAGGGFNILCAAARQGLRCIFAGRHGSGPHGERIRAELAREGVIASSSVRPMATPAFASFLSSRMAREPSSRVPESRPISRDVVSPTCRSRLRIQFSRPVTISPIQNLGLRSPPGWPRRLLASALS